MEGWGGGVCVIDTYKCAKMLLLKSNNSSLCFCYRWLCVYRELSNTETMAGILPPHSCSLGKIISRSGCCCCCSGGQQRSRRRTFCQTVALLAPHRERRKRRKLKGRRSVRCVRIRFPLSAPHNRPSPTSTDSLLRLQKFQILAVTSGKVPGYPVKRFS